MVKCVFYFLISLHSTPSHPQFIVLFYERQINALFLRALAPFRWTRR